MLWGDRGDPPTIGRRSRMIRSLRSENELPLPSGVVARDKWSDSIGWEPVLKLAIRSLGARAAWLRVDDETRIVSRIGDLPEYVERWVAGISAEAVAGEYLDEVSAGLRAIGVSLGAEIGGPFGSIGVLTGPSLDAPLSEHWEVLGEVSRSVRGNLALWRGASANADAMNALSILSRAITNMQLGVTITDADGNIVFTNPAEARMHGYEVYELIGKPASLLAPPPVRGSRRRRVVADGATWTRESVNRHRDGRHFPVLLWSDVIEDTTGGFCGVVTCSEDLTARRKVEAALRRSETMFRTIFDDAPVGLALLGHEGWILRANPRLGLILDLRQDAPSDLRLLDFLHPDEPAATHRAYEAALARTGGGDSKVEHRIVREDGTSRWIDVTISPIHDAPGECPLWIALVQDSTERRGLEDQVRHSQKMDAVGRLAGGIAHDFNNLLTTIQGTTEILLSEADPAHPMVPDIREIHRAAESAAGLTAQLLAFSRRETVSYQVQDLNSIICASERVFARMLGSGISLELNLDPGLPAILADRSQIEQVIINLLVNARDASTPGRSVALSTRFLENQEGEAGLIELVVADKGQGIPADHLERIFEPFFTTKERGSGTGLGLSIVYGIVEQIGGQIRVDSTIGVGTIVRIQLPVARQDEERGTGAGSRPRNILLAMTDTQRRQQLTAALERGGARVLLSSTSMGVVEIAESFGDRIDGLVLDDLCDGSETNRLLADFHLLREDTPVVKLSPLGSETPASIEEGDQERGELRQVLALLERIEPDEGGVEELS
jgi:two-component system, cell cycle sensor histidine kinase and response regulator CckA